MRTKRRHNSNGFTLLELILAMAMVAALSLSLYSSLNIAYKAKRSTEAAARPIRAIAIAADMIGRDLEGVLPPTGTFREPFLGFHEGAVGASLDRIEFSAITNESSGNEWDPLAEGIHRIALYVRTDVNPPVLVRAVVRNLLSSVEPVPQEEVLISGVRSFTVRYFDGEAWYEDWDSTLILDLSDRNTLPRAVSIDLELEPPPGAPETQTYRIMRVIPLPCSTL